MAMDQAAVLSLVYHAAMNGLASVHPVKEDGRIKWTFDFVILKAGWTPVEILHRLAYTYKRLHMDLLNVARYYGDFEHAKKIQARNAINTLARILFYNDPANRFEAVIN